MSEADKHKGTASGEAGNDQNAQADKTAWAKPLPERLPRPTIWPATVSLGSTLLAFGVVTSWFMSAAGLVLFVMGAHGWFEELRNDQLQ